jgi:hypothetical protein
VGSKSKFVRLLEEKGESLHQSLGLRLELKGYKEVMICREI